jgi:hypothetical protein
MNRIKKFIIPLLIFVFSSLASYAQNDCIVALLANDLSSSTVEFKTTVKQSEGFQAWQLLNKEKPALRTNIEELVLVSKNLEAIKSAKGYVKWKELQGAGRHPNWVEITGIANKVEDLTPHVLKVETNTNGAFIPKSKTIGTTTFNMEGFKGCHTENALKEYVQANGGTYAVKNKSVGVGGVYEGQPVIYLNNKEYVKINGQFAEYEAGKLGGTSSFFPENWSDIKIKEEVDFAIANNHGMAQDGSNSLYGFSKDGTVEIRFYLNNDGSIGSYFPKKR